LRGHQLEALALAEHEQGLAERLGERRVPRQHERLALGLERLAAARVEHVAEAPASDLGEVPEAPRDREGPVAQGEDAQEASGGRARQQPPARRARRRSEGPGAALPEVEQRRPDARLAQQREHAVERIALRDTAQVHRRSLRELRASVVEHAHPPAPDAAARLGDRAAGRKLAARGRLVPEVDEGAHGHVEGAARELRERGRAGKELRHLGRHGLRAAPGRGVEPAHVAGRVPGRHLPLEALGLGEERAHDLAQRRLVAAHQRDLEDRSHRVAAVARGRERELGRPRAGEGERGQDRGAAAGRSPAHC
jgi:hypothetical protein